MTVDNDCLVEACVGPSTTTFAVIEDSMTSYATALQYIASRPFGIYTCARVLPFDATSDLEAEDPTKHLVLWQYHLVRVAMSLQLEWKDRPEIQQYAARLQEATNEVATRMLQVWTTTKKALAGQQGMLTVLWWQDPQRSDVIRIGVHVCELPSRAVQAINVLVHGGPRHNPTCKHTQWTADRQSLIDFMNHCEIKVDGEKIALTECILSEPDAETGDRCLLEGMTSNFFVVKNGSLYTAEASVLKGSMRELVFRACNELEIPVVLEAPRLAEAATWHAAFITSCTRIVHPIAYVCWLDMDGEAQHVTLRHLQSEQMLTALRERIQDRLGKWE